jgi:uncharacterized membrane protein
MIMSVLVAVSVLLLLLLMLMLCVARRGAGGVREKRGGGVRGAEVWQGGGEKKEDGERVVCG